MTQQQRLGKAPSPAVVPRSAFPARIRATQARRNHLAGSHFYRLRYQRPSHPNATVCQRTCPTMNAVAPVPVQELDRGLEWLLVAVLIAGLLVRVPWAAMSQASMMVSMTVVAEYGMRTYTPLDRHRHHRTARSSTNTTRLHPLAMKSSPTLGIHIPACRTARTDSRRMTRKPPRILHLQDRRSNTANSTIRIPTVWAVTNPLSNSSARVSSKRAGSLRMRTMSRAATRGAQGAPRRLWISSDAWEDRGLGVDSVAHFPVR